MLGGVNQCNIAKLWTKGYSEQIGYWIIKKLLCLSRANVRSITWPSIRYHTDNVGIANELINQKTDRRRLVHEQAELMSFVWIRLRILLLPSNPVPVRAIVPWHQSCRIFPVRNRHEVLVSWCQSVKTKERKRERKMKTLVTLARTQKT